MLEDLVRQQQKEINIINSFLKNHPSQILDIGCGLGIYDLALYDFYKKDIKFILLDKTTTNDDEKKIHYGYREKAAFYNNLDYTKDFLQSNCIDEKHMEIISVNDNQNITNEYLKNNLSNIDLVISIISWGFHYPVETYLDTVYQIISDHGILCLQCRNIGKNLPILQSKFNILWPDVKKIREGSLLICQKIL